MRKFFWTQKKKKKKKKVLPPSANWLFLLLQENFTIISFSLFLGVKYRQTIKYSTHNESSWVACEKGSLHLCWWWKPNRILLLLLLVLLLLLLLSLLSLFIYLFNFFTCRSERELVARILKNQLSTAAWFIFLAMGDFLCK